MSRSPYLEIRNTGHDQGEKETNPEDDAIADTLTKNWLHCGRHLEGHRRRADR
jgi:hypothetical protein